eukprot:CAMPEP_0170325216 /NCGR_PEP_ID=MMETSP0116_2-20130129/63468_1 /TAXON_ID=400756 /ORGANISM="Durinskia baltica, Strain CSIRO CS-38" /LENGTH=51 /DNA_ID=CAMNT_0010578239 /DNA_START=20 /DNA_END=171 /DNA_ORIENTATION=-
MTPRTNNRAARPKTWANTFTRDWPAGTRNDKDMLAPETHKKHGMTKSARRT